MSHHQFYALKPTTRVTEDGVTRGHDITQLYVAFFINITEAVSGKVDVFIESLESFSNTWTTLLEAKNLNSTGTTRLTQDFMPDTTIRVRWVLGDLPADMTFNVSVAAKDA